jgi:DNA repair protein RadD
MFHVKQLRSYQKQAISECWEALKANDDPVLLMASVGSGKSLMLSAILLEMERHNKRALCIVNNAELVRNNAETFKQQGGNPSIYCAALNSKDHTKNIVFGTPQSIINGIKHNQPIADIKFNLIVVDEGHMINHIDHRSMFMRILNHYKQQYQNMRLLGATGTNFRFKGSAIVGDDCLFKSQVGNITTSYLIEHGYLTKPTFTIESPAIDFSGIKINSMGKFDPKQLNAVIDENQRLTGIIIKHLIHIMESQNRFGCFIFASTRKHATECLSHLPPNESALITGDTPQHERIVILDKARSGEIKYLVNISILTIGIDVPSYDTLLFVRPTESLVLMVQMIGRALRLADGKTDALVIDCAGNIQRHSNWDDPILLDAVKQTRDPDEERPFKCYQCGEMNGLHARRCIGTVDNKRCDFYFEFKECPSCLVQNDIASRVCRSCNHELIDPNAKLSLDPFQPDHIELNVLEAQYKLTGNESHFSLHIQYKCDTGLMVYERYTPSSEKARNVFYGRLVKPSVINSIEYYPRLMSMSGVQAMLADVRTPITLLVKPGNNGFTIKKRVFHLDTQE